MVQPDATKHLTKTLIGPEATEAFAVALSAHLKAGDTLLLGGPIGAGKSLLARTIIQTLQRPFGAPEDVPSPTFTLVQTYQAGAIEIWHADLYRVSDPSEIIELGLDEALGQALCMIEWPDRLGTDAPPNALVVSIEVTQEGAARQVSLTGAVLPWTKRLAPMQSETPA